MLETIRAAKPAAVANSDAVQATNLFVRANTWCVSTGTPAGRSTKREWMYTSVAVAVTRMVIGTIGETMVSVPPVAPMYAMEVARHTPNASRKAISVRRER